MENTELHANALLRQDLPLREKLRWLASQYSGELRNALLPRIQFHIELVQKLTGKTKPTIADIGGGVGLFSVGCASVGMTVTLVDDFLDDVNLSQSGRDALELHRKLGVEVKRQDASKDLSLEPNRYDAITTFDSIEHWHRSPKKAFRAMMKGLRNSGWVIVCLPNCVNLRKRISVPLGRGKWSTMSMWYEQEEFRGHVREPDVADMLYMGRDMGLEEIRVFGRNWLGYSHAKLRKMMPVIDACLRPWPSLCSDLYLVGRKPAGI